MTKTSSMLTTTLTRIRQHGPCAVGWRKLVRHLGPGWPDEAPIPLAIILDSNGFEDAVWCLRACDGGPAVAAVFAQWCAGRAIQYAATNASYATSATNAADAARAAADAYAVYAYASGAYFRAAAADRAARAAAYALAAADAARTAAAHAAAAEEAAYDNAARAAYAAERALQAEHLRSLVG